MSDKYQTLSEMLQAWFGGGVTTLIAALTGRLMWHTAEVRRSKRSFFGWELLWELPFAVGMGLIGEGVATYIDAGPLLRPAIVGGLAYLGPRGTEVLLAKLLRPARQDLS